MASQEENDLLSTQQQLLTNILDLMKQVVNTTNNQTNASSRQSEVTNALNESLEQNVDLTNDQTTAGQQLQSSLKNSTEGVDALANALGRGGKQGRQTKKSIDGLKIATNALANSFEAVTATAGLFFDGFKAAGGIIKGAIGLVTGFFDELMGLAADYYNNNAQEMIAANRAIQDSFGELYKYQGAAVREMTKTFKDANSSYVKTGVSIYNTIGSIGQQFEFINSIATNLGNTFIAMQKTVMASIDEFAVLNKAMKLSEESFKQMLTTAKAAGQDVEESMKTMMTASVGLSKEFGISVKVIGKNMDVMVKDFAHFGEMGPKELAAVATYTAKLGVEIQSLAGIMDTFDTFDGAAASAGKLAEVFGMNVDVMKMMNTENPAERMDELRKSFEATGKSVGDLSRHEMKMLSEAMGGMPIQDLQQALSVNTDELGYGDFEDAAEAAAEKLTPEQAMQNMADAITKLNQNIAQLADGPLKSFISGFTYSVNMSQEFRDILKGIGNWLKVFMKAGKAVGKVFADVVLGSAKVKGFINDMFDVGKAEDFMSKVTGAFTEFFNLLVTDPRKAVNEFLQKIWDGFRTFFSGGGQLSGMSGLGGMIKEMFVGAFEFLAANAPQLIKDISKYIIQITQSMSDFASGKQVSGNLAGGLGTAFVDAIGNIWAAVKSDLLPALGGLLKEIASSIMPIILPILVGVFAITFAKGIVMGIAQAATQAIVGAAFAGLGKTLAKMFNSADATDTSSVNNQLTESTSVVDTIKGLIESLVEISPRDALKAAANLTILALGVGASMVVFASAFTLASIIIAKLSWDELIKGIVGMTATVIALIGISYAAQMAENIDIGSVMKTLLGMAVVAAVGLTAVAAGIWASMKIMESVVNDKTIQVLTVFGLAVGAVAILGAIALGAAAVFNQATVAVQLSTFIGMAAFMAIGVVAAIGGFALMSYVWDKAALDAEKMMIISTALITAISAISIMGVAVMGMAWLAGAAPAIGMGLAAMVAFTAALYFGIPFIVKTFSKVAEMTDTLDLDQAITAFTTLGLVFGATLAIAASTVGLALASPVLALGAVGIGVAIGFLKLVTPGITSMARTIKEISIADPEKMESGVKIVAEIAKIIESLGGLAIEQTKMQAASKLMNNANIRKSFGAMSGFLDQVVVHVEDIIDNLLSVTSNYSKKDLDKLAPLGQVIGAIAQVIGNLAQPMQTLGNAKGNITKTSKLWGLSSTEKEEGKDSVIGKMIQGTLDFVKALMGTPNQPGPIFDLIDQFAVITQSISNPKVFEKQAKGFEILMNSISKGINTVITVAKSLNDTKFNWKEITKTFKDFSQFMVDTIPDIFSGVDIISSTTLKVDEKLAKTINQNLNAVLTVFDQVKETFSEYSQISKDLQIMFEDNGSIIHPSTIVAALVEETDKVVDSLNDLQISTRVKATNARHILGFEGTRTFKVKPEAVNVTVNLQVKMDAEELALSIAKGNKKSQGFFQRTPVANDMLLEALAKEL